MPKDTSLFDQIENLTRLATTQIGKLNAILDRRPDSITLAAEIEKDRHEAHGLSRQVLQRLDAAFITPFDREDILEIANALYRVTARVASTAERIELYKTREIHPSLRGQCKTLNAMASEVSSVMHQLSAGRGLSEMREHLDEVGRLEEAARQDRRSFLLELYQSSPDPSEVMKKREIHDLLMDAIGACDELGKTIERVLLKNE
jgi:uncharacterized protein